MGTLKGRLAQLEALPEAEIEPEIPLLLAVLHCYHGEMQARLGIHDPTRQTNLDVHLSTLRKFGSLAYPELADVLSGAGYPFTRRLVDGHATYQRYNQEALTLYQSLGDRVGQWLALRSLGFAALFAGQFATAAGYVDQLFALAETAADAHSRLPALYIRGLLQQAGQPEQALVLIGLVQHHPSSYRESKDRLADLEAELRAKLAPKQVQAALARGQAGELWETVAAMRSQLDEGCA